MNICKNLSVMAPSRVQPAGYGQRLSCKESWRAAGSTERLYEERPYKYRAISSALRFGTQ